MDARTAEQWADVPPVVALRGSENREEEVVFDKESVPGCVIALRGDWNGVGTFPKPRGRGEGILEAVKSCGCGCGSPHPQPSEERDCLTARQMVDRRCAPLYKLNLHSR